MDFRTHVDAKCIKEMKAREKGLSTIANTFHLASSAWNPPNIAGTSRLDFDSPGCPVRKRLLVEAKLTFSAS